jgi:N-acetylglutamate synthase-like GNAT family acetyltransferase
MRMHEAVIVPWERKYATEVIQLILSIQQKEFQISITEADQPDLSEVDTFYQHDNGNFWIALSDAKVVGTLALLDIGHQQVALRKMFVHRDFRGKSIGLANNLLRRAIGWCSERNIQDIYLGTVVVLKAAHRFYEKNGFERVEREELPSNFPIMGVDTIFYHLSIQE